MQPNQGQEVFILLIFLLNKAFANLRTILIAVFGQIIAVKNEK